MSPGWAAPDNWSTITSQYGDSSGQGPLFGGSVLGGTWFDNAAAAPAGASQSDLAAEAITAAQHFGVSGDDIDVFVLSPSGTQPDGFPNAGWCAWHDYTSSTSGSIPYTNMPYVLDAGSGCGASSVQNQLDGFSIVGGHEYAEAITDPEPPGGWLDSSGQEIGDKCAWQNLSTLSLSTGTFAVQPLWSNNDSGCTLSAPQSARRASSGEPRDWPGRWSWPLVLARTGAHWSRLSSSAHRSRRTTSLERAPSANATGIRRAPL